MMRKIRKLCLILSLLLVLTVFIAAPANAATLISSYNCGISDSGTLRVSWNASTVCNTYVDTGTLTVKLQYYNSGTWTNVATFYDSETDNIVITDSGNRYVSTAGTYRVSTTHYVKDGGTIQTRTSTSNSTYVN